MCIDAHIHLSLDGIDFHKSRQRYKDGDYSQIAKSFDEYIKQGIYVIRDGGDDLGISPMAKEIADEMGIIYKTPINSFYKTGYYGDFTGKAVIDIKDFKDQFDHLMLKKPDHLKIILTGIVDFDVFGRIGEMTFTFQELYYMIQSAKDKGLPVMVHANSPQAVQNAVKAGADTIEHGYFITHEELHLMAGNNVIWVPTLSPIGNLITCDEFKNSKKIANIKKIYDLQINNVRDAYGIGVKMALGSDAGAYKVLHGKGFYDEVAHFEYAGICKEAIYKMALENGAKALGLEASEIEIISNR